MVYFIRTDCKKYVKIGYSKDPATRLKELQTGNPRPLKLLFTLEGGFKTEQGFHELYSKYKTKAGNEWFSITGKLKAATMLLEGTQGIDLSTISCARDLEAATCHLQIRQRQNRRGIKLV